MSAPGGADKHLIAYCDGGLGNRLNALIGAIWFARQLHLQLSISWPLNRWCAAPLEDLLDTPYPVDRRSMPELNEQCASHVLLAHARQAFTLPGNFNPDRVLWPRSLLDQLRAALQRADGMVYFNSLVPAYISRSTIEDIVRTVVIKAEYRRRADEFLEQAGLLGKSYWGLHLRGTDAGFSPGYYASWYRLCRLLPGRIVLCTDDPAIEARFLRNPAVIRRPTTALPRKASEGRGWNAVTRDEYGREAAYNIYRGADAVRESMVDFEILARSRPLPTSESTFLENARRFGGRRPPLAWLQDTRAWLRFAYAVARAR